MTAGEKIFYDLFCAKGYTIQIPKNNTSKSPDFGVYHGQNLLCWCEVKDKEDIDNEYFRCPGKKIPDEVKIILTKIYEAHKQFVAVNPDHSKPNILAFHCDRIGMSQNDVLDAVFGYVEYEGGHRLYREAKGDADARTMTIKYDIDVFLFHKNGELSILYNITYFPESILKSIGIKSGRCSIL